MLAAAMAQMGVGQVTGVDKKTWDGSKTLLNKFCGCVKHHKNLETYLPTKIACPKVITTQQHTILIYTMTYKKVMYTYNPP